MKKKASRKKRGTNSWTSVACRACTLATSTSTTHEQHRAICANCVCLFCLGPVVCRVSVGLDTPFAVTAVAVICNVVSCPKSVHSIFFSSFVLCLFLRARITLTQTSEYLFIFRLFFRFFRSVSFFLAVHSLCCWPVLYHLRAVQIAYACMTVSIPLQLRCGIYDRHSIVRCQ